MKRIANMTNEELEALIQQLDRLYYQKRIEHADGRITYVGVIPSTNDGEILAKDALNVPHADASSENEVGMKSMDDRAKSGESMDNRAKVSGLGGLMLWCAHTLPSHPATPAIGYDSSFDAALDEDGPRWLSQWA